MIIRWISRTAFLTLAFAPAYARAQSPLAASLEASIGGINRAGGDYINRDLLLFRAAGVVELARSPRWRPLVVVSLEASRNNAGQVNCVSPGGCTPFFPSLSGYGAAAGIATRVVSRVNLRPTFGINRYVAAVRTHTVGPAAGLGAEVDVVQHVGFVADYHLFWSRFRGSPIRLASYAVGIAVH